MLDRENLCNLCRRENRLRRRVSETQNCGPRWAVPLITRGENENAALGHPGASGLLFRRARFGCRGWKLHLFRPPSQATLQLRSTAQLSNWQRGARLQYVGGRSSPRRHGLRRRIISQLPQPWLGSRAISRKRPTTANDFSLGKEQKGACAVDCKPVLGRQPGGSPLWFAAQQSGRSGDRLSRPGIFVRNRNDPMVGNRVGGVNIFGGGLALYASGEVRVGASASAVIRPAPIIRLPSVCAILDLAFGSIRWRRPAPQDTPRQHHLSAITP